MRLSFFENLTLIFVTLKLLGIVDWTWFECFKPVLFGAIILVVLSTIKSLLERRK